MSILRHSLLWLCQNLFTVSFSHLATFLPGPDMAKGTNDPPCMTKSQHKVCNWSEIALTAYRFKEYRSDIVCYCLKEYLHVSHILISCKLHGGLSKYCGKRFQTDERESPKSCLCKLASTNNVSTERLKWRPMLRQMRKSTLSQALHVRITSDALNIQSSDWHKWLTVCYDVT